MNEPIAHADFEELLLRQRHEPLSAGEATQLQAHLDVCAHCRQIGEALDVGLRSLASQALVVPASLTAATRARLSQREAELTEAASRMRWVMAASLLAGVLGLLTARALWLGIDWLGQQWDVPVAGLVSLFVVVWFAPATLGGLAALAWRSRLVGLSRAMEEE
jgi:hypothetical protein